jgi:catechol 2,3-dioxygenase-like lactoylglutathione lyase family enzyme
MFKDSNAFSGFAVRDLAAAKSFYGDTLGLDARDGPMGMLELHLGSGAVVLVYPKEDHQAANYTILNFPVKDVDAAVDQLREAGIQMEQYGADFGQDEKGIARGNEGPTIAWFKDPSGNIIAVLDEGPPA